MTSPPPERSKLTPELLLRAYAAGIFPMSESRHAPDIFWVDPERRGILPLDGLHIPRSLKKTLRKNPFDVRIDTAFADVVHACAAPREGHPDTWINPEIEAAYTSLHQIGFAHSVECWRNGRLVGGLYGVSLAGAFFGESMFSRATDASKVALVHLVARLRLGGYVLLDTQFMTEHLQRFGVMEIPARDYLVRLNAALQVVGRFGPDDQSTLGRAAGGGGAGSTDWPGDVVASEIERLSLQSSAQTS